jgi:hypothetical protein
VTWRRAVQFNGLRYLSAQHWVLSRAVFACIGYVLGLVLTGQTVLAQDTARLFWHDRYKTALHRLDWYAHYGWLRRFLRRKPAFDVTEDMPHAGLAALEAVLKTHRSSADLCAMMYLQAAYLAQATTPETKALHLEGYRAIADQIASRIPAPLPDPPKAALAFTKTQARTTLQDAGHLMQRLQFPWYIVSGTFLGAVREADFLAHDYDVDIGVHAEDFDHAVFLAGLRADPNFCLVRIEDYVDLKGPELTAICAPALYKIMHRTGVEVDIFLHYLEGAQRWHGSARHRWWNADFATAPYTIADLTVAGPSDADTYLRENYGDWRTPKTTFNCSTGTPNVSFNRNLPSIARFITQGQAGSQTAISVLTAQGYLKDGRFTFPWG